MEDLKCGVSGLQFFIRSFIELKESSMDTHILEADFPERENRPFQGPACFKCTPGKTGY